MTDPRQATVIAEPGWLWPLLTVALPTLGAATGWLLLRGLDWWQQRDWPFPGALRLLTAAPEPWLTLSALVLGAVAGLALTVAWRHDSPVVTLTTDQIRYTKADTTREIPRRHAAAAFAAQRQLVILDRAGAELLHAPCDLSTHHLADAFTRHGIRWYPDGDPHHADYRRWVPGLPELPAGADALFTARAAALDRDDTDDADELRTELGRLGVVVHDRDGRQHWRLPHRLDP